MSKGAVEVVAIVLAFLIAVSWLFSPIIQWVAILTVGIVLPMWILQARHWRKLLEAYRKN